MFSNLMVRNLSARRAGAAYCALRPSRIRIPVFYLKSLRRAFSKALYPKQPAKEGHRELQANVKKRWALYRADAVEHIPAARSASSLRARRVGKGLSAAKLQSGLYCLNWPSMPRIKEHRARQPRVASVVRGT